MNISQILKCMNMDIDNVNIKELISTTDERPPLLKGHAKGVASQEGFHCNYITDHKMFFNLLIIILIFSTALYFKYFIQKINSALFRLYPIWIRHVIYFWVKC